MSDFLSVLLGFIRIKAIDYIFLIIIAVAIVGISFLLRDKRWITYLCASSIIVVVGLALYELIPMYKDYENKSFVQMEDITIVSTTSAGFDNGFRDVCIRDSVGKELHLQTTEQFEKGEFKADVVYSERSLYLIEFTLE